MEKNKKLSFITVLILISLSTVFGQMRSDYYDAFYGGGIGYTPGLVIVPEILLPESDETIDFSGAHFFHGFQGWGNITRKWRVGASILAGTDQQTFDVSGSDTIVFTQFTMTSSYLFSEYILAVSAKTQLAFNLGAGITNFSIKYFRNPNNGNWDNLFTSPGSGTHLTVKSAVSLYPMVSYLWQFMHRGGLRLNAGASMSFVPQSSWKIDDFYSVSNAADGTDQFLVSPVFQMFIYFWFPDYSKTNILPHLLGK